MEVAVEKISPEDIAERFEVLPPSLKDAASSDGVLQQITQICLDNNLANGDEILFVQQMCGLVLLGFLKPNDFAETIDPFLAVEDFNSLIKLGEALNQKIFSTYAKDLESLYSKNQAAVAAPAANTAPVSAATEIPSTLKPEVPAVGGPVAIGTPGESTIKPVAPAIAPENKNITAGLAAAPMPVVIRGDAPIKPVTIGSSAPGLSKIVPSIGLAPGDSSDLIAKSKKANSLPPKVARVDFGPDLALPVRPGAAPLEPKTAFKAPGLPVTNPAPTAPIIKEISPLNIKISAPPPIDLSIKKDTPKTQPPFVPAPPPPPTTKPAPKTVNYTDGADSIPKP